MSSSDMEDTDGIGFIYINKGSQTACLRTDLPVPMEGG